VQVEGRPSIVFPVQPIADADFDLAELIQHVSFVIVILRPCR
jgi:hypothetical protein